MTANRMGNDQEIRDELLKRLREPAGAHSNPERAEAGGKDHGLMAAMGSAPERERDPVRWGRWAENAVGAFVWNAGQTLCYWRAEPLEVDWVLDGSWGAWAIEVKTGAYRPQDLRGLLEFCRLYPKFQPLLLCNEGDEASGCRWKTLRSTPVCRPFRCTPYAA